MKERTQIPKRIILPADKDGETKLMNTEEFINKIEIWMMTMFVAKVKHLTNMIKKRIEQQLPTSYSNQTKLKKMISSQSIMFRAFEDKPKYTTKDVSSD